MPSSGRSATDRSGGAWVRRAALAIVLATLLLATAPGLRPPPAAAASSSPAVDLALRSLHIDTQAFQASIPTNPVVGRNYTLALMISNASNESIPIVIGVHTTLGAVSVQPLEAQAVIGPGKSMEGNFSMVPFAATSQGPVNVTASVFVWFVNLMPRPQLAVSVSALIFTIQPYPYAPVIEAAAAAALVLGAAAVLVHLRRSGRGTPDGAPSGVAHSHRLLK